MRRIWAWLKAFRLRRRARSYFPVRSAVRQRHSGLLFTQNAIVVVDFAQQTSFRDSQDAAMCIIVLASDGSRATVSHLTTPQFDRERMVKAKLFAWRLREHWQKPVPICLVGGNTLISESFIEALVAELAEEGFQVDTDPRRNDLLQGTLVYREATVYQDKVVVTKRHYRGDSEERVLSFS